MPRPTSVMNATLNDLRQRLERLHREKPAHLYAAGALLLAALLAVIIVATSLLTAPPTTAEQLAALPPSARTDTWRTVAIQTAAAPTPDTPTLLIQLPDTPVKAPNDTRDSAIRHLYTGEYFTLVCGVMPSPTPILGTHPNPADDIARTLRQQRLDDARSALRTLVAEEITASSLGGQRVTLPTQPDAAPCVYRGADALFLTGDAACGDAHLKLNARLFVFNHAAIYLYTLHDAALADAGDTLVRHALDSIRFLTSPVQP